MVRPRGFTFSTALILIGGALTIFSSALTGLATVSIAEPAAKALQAQNESPGVSAAIDRPIALAVSRQFQQALDAFHDADNLSNHTCADCYLGMVKMECQLGDLSGALADAQNAARAAGDDRILAARALLLRAGLLIATSSGPADEKVKEAESEYRQALSLNPKESTARFALGMLLLREGRDSEGIAELKAYVSGPLANPRYVERANRVIADPDSAKAMQAEDFSFSTIEGETISKAKLQGKVVLLDFWASWCGPCVKSVPIMADLNRKFAGSEFELVGIDSDSDEPTLRGFASSYNMNWKEFFDKDGRMRELFEVQGFPTYIVLGRDGTIQFQQTGLGPYTPTDLSDVITRELAKTYTGPAAVVAATPAGSADAEPVSASSAPVRLAFTFPPNDVENGDSEGNTYRNGFLGLSYKFPGTWAAAEPEVVDQLNQIRLRQIQSEDVGGTGGQAGPNGSVRVPFPLIVFQASPDERQRIPAVSISVTQTSASAAESARKEADALKQQNVSILVPPREITIGKRQFFRTDFVNSQGDPPAWIAMIETSVGQHYLVTLEMRAHSKQELDDLAASAQTLLISKP